MNTYLVRLRPRTDTLYVSQNRSVLVTSGWVSPTPAQTRVFFVHGTKLISRYIVGSCHAPLALRVDWRRQLRRHYSQLGSRWVRFHGLLWRNERIALEIELRPHAVAALTADLPPA